ncbi:MAG TPA: response regulator [Rhizomicrobium sp.]|nr:response regulator [Rhizomicrobium sp.]
MEKDTAGQAGIVYIVDDDDAVRDSTVWLLKAAGLGAVAFASAGAFLESFDPRRKAVILLDLHMPGMSGLELLELLQARRVRTPVIVISGRRDPQLDELVTRAGAIAILGKPSGKTELLTLVRQALDSQTG